MLLQSMSFALNVRGDRLASRQFDSGHLSLSRVRFLRFRREYLRADALLLIATLEGGRL